MRNTLVTLSNLFTRANLSLTDIMQMIRGGPQEDSTPLDALDLALLESRVMFSASPLDPALVEQEMVAEGGEWDFAGGEEITLLEASQAEVEVTDGDLSFDLEGLSGLNLADVEALSAGAARELVFVDASVPDVEQLLLDVLSAQDSGRDIEIVLISGDQDGIEQITKTLRDRRDVDAIHVISHSTEGAVQLGNAVLDNTTIQGYAAQLAQWSDSLSSSADLLFYGCDLAGNAEGQLLLESLHALCDCDVAASTDVTGHAALGGDWDLEYETGVIDVAIVVSNDVTDDWLHRLANSITVTTIADAVNGDTSSFDALILNDGGDGISLREAIIAANNQTGADTINLGAGTYTLSIAGTAEDAAATGDFDVLSQITIVGADAATTIIDANSIDRVFDVQAGSLTLSELTVTGGAGTNGAGVYVDSGTTLNLSRVIVSNNVASGDGGGLYNLGTVDADQVRITGNQADLGGGLVNSGTATMTNSLVDGNTATFGGGLRNVGAGNSLTLENVTISGNTATSQGGALQNSSQATLTNVTITDNQAAQSGGIHESTGGTKTYLTNSIIAGNTLLDGTTASDVGGGFESQGFNIIGNSDGTSGWVGSDQTGTVGSPLAPLLGPLADNGGFTMTHALLSGSLAIDQGTSTGAPTTDQRGITRDASVDIGAFEFLPAPTITSNGGGATASVSVGENTTAVTTVTATDPDGDTLSYSITGGVDAAKFTINGSTGELNFGSAPDFESPTDAGANNVYDVQVTVSDGNGGTDVQDIAVTVTNVNDAPTVDLDANDSSGSSSGNFATSWTELGGPVSVVDADAVIADVDSGTLTSVTATLVVRLDGSDEVLSADAGATGITVSYDSGDGRAYSFRSQFGSQLSAGATYHYVRQHRYGSQRNDAGDHLCG